MDHGQCAQLLGELSDYLDGEASDEICMEIEHHLEGCEHCRVVVDTLRKTIALVHDQPSEDLPDDVRERLYISLDLADVMTPRARK